MSIRHKAQAPKSVDDLFKEFADENSTCVDQDEEAIPARSSVVSSPFMRAIDSLAAIFEREADALGAADYDRFKRLQGEKLSAIRNVERLQKDVQTSLSASDRETLEARLNRFNAAVERNMKRLDAVRQATQAVHRYAVKAVEEKQSDGVYAKDGSIRGMACLSVNGNQIKL